MRPLGKSCVGELVPCSLKKALKFDRAEQTPKVSGQASGVRTQATLVWQTDQQQEKESASVSCSHSLPRCVLCAFVGNPRMLKKAEFAFGVEEQSDSLQDAHQDGDEEDYEVGDADKARQRKLCYGQTAGSARPVPCSLTLLGAPQVSTTSAVHKDIRFARRRQSCSYGGRSSFAPITAPRGREFHAFGSDRPSHPRAFCRKAVLGARIFS